VLFAGDLPIFISKVNYSFPENSSTSSYECVRPEIKRRSECSTFFVQLHTVSIKNSSSYECCHASFLSGYTPIANESMTLQICTLEVSGSSLTIMDEMMLFGFSQILPCRLGWAWIRKSVQWQATGWTTRIRVSARAEIFLIDILSRPTVGPSQLRVFGACK
jgi:hypothetical protein